VLGVPFIWHVRVAESGGWRDKVIASLCSKIVVLSEAVKRKFAWIKEEGKIVKIYNAVDTDVFRPGLDTEYLHKEFNIAEDKNVIGIFSRMDDFKGHDLLIDSAEVMKNNGKDVMVLIVGEGEENYKNKLLDRAASAGLEGDVVFTGFRDDVPELMNFCDVVVNLSVEPEGFGRTIIEAMACGVPVVSTDIGGPVEIINDGEDGYLVKPKPEDIAEAVMGLLEDRENKSRISANAAEKVADNFTVENQIQRLKDLYKSVLGLDK
jgi:glycosyltransferase involved in cell wall biosynthesis